MRQLLSFKSAMLILVGIVICLGISLIICFSLNKPADSPTGNEKTISAVPEINA